MPKPTPTIIDSDTSNPTALKLVVSELRRRGFDALYHEDSECGCSINDIAPCGEGPYPDCRAAYWQMCKGTPDNPCQYGGNCGEYHAYTRKPVEAGDARP